MTTTEECATSVDAPNLRIDVTGETFAYRRIGIPSVTLPPLILLQHFRGNLDYWDPALLDVLAADREVITVDLAGVGGSTGTTPDTVGDMARDALRFIDALALTSVDLLGFAGRPHRPGDRSDPPTAAAAPGARRNRTAGRTGSAPLVR